MQQGFHLSTNYTVFLILLSTEFSVTSSNVFFQLSYLYYLMFTKIPHSKCKVLSFYSLQRMLQIVQNC